MGPKKRAARLNQTDDVRKSFKWSKEHQMGMAEYVKENYDSYKRALGTQKKMAFLRKMKDALDLGCDDIQLKNGFRNFIKKYDEIRAKLNASGFGVDPEKDSSLDKGWIKKACPYFDVLDDVMNSRPNVTPPAVLSTATINDEGNGEGTISRDPLEENNDVITPEDDPLSDLPDANAEEQSNEQNENSILVDDVSTTGEDIAAPPGSYSASPDPVTAKFVKQAFTGLNLKRHEEMRGPLGIFAKVMGDKTMESMKIEKEKLLQNAAQFEINQKIQQERNHIELHKVNSQIDIENQKLQLEKERLADKKAEREHEIVKITMQQQFELQRLELLKNKD